MFVTKDFMLCRHQPLFFLLMYFIWRKNKMFILYSLFQGMLNNVNIRMLLTIHRASQWFSGKEFNRQCRRHGSGPWVRKIPCRRKCQPTLVFLLGNPMDRGAWRAAVHGVQQLVPLPRLTLWLFIDEPRDCHVEWNKSEKDKHHMISLTRNTKNIVQMNLTTKQK